MTFADSRVPAGTDLEIAVDDPRARRLAPFSHPILRSARATTPRDTRSPWRGAPRGPEVTFLSARRGTVVVDSSAKRIDDSHAELKSMHTRAEVRRRGIAKALVAYILAFARQAGYERVSLETGTTHEFLPARSLYASMGFMPYDPFGAYQASPYNSFLSITLDSHSSPSSTAHGSEDRASMDIGDCHRFLRSVAQNCTAHATRRAPPGRPRHAVRGGRCDSC